MNANCESLHGGHLAVGYNLLSLRHFLQAVLQMEQRKQQQQEQNAPPSKPEGQLQFRADAGTGSGPWTLGLKESAWESWIV